MAGRVRFRLGDSEVEVEGDPKFIDKYLNKFLDRLGGEGAASAVFKKTDLPSQIAAVAKAKRVPSPAEFYREKQPDTGTETLVVVEVSRRLPFRLGVHSSGRSEDCKGGKA